MSSVEQVTPASSIKDDKPDTYRECLTDQDLKDTESKVRSTIHTDCVPGTSHNEPVEVPRTTPDPEKVSRVTTSRESSLSHDDFGGERRASGTVLPKSHSPTPRLPATIHFFSGNPCVERTKGILHIYKDG